MKRLSVIGAAFCVIFGGTNCAAQEKPEVFYTVTVKSYERQTLHVAMTIDHPAEENVSVAIPAWAPGYYKITHYEAGISNVKATGADHKPLPVTRAEPRVWTVARPANSESVKFEYDCAAKDAGLGFFGSKLYANGGYINGPSALMYYVGHTDSSAHFTLEAKGAKQAMAPLASFGENLQTSTFMYHADSYDELADAPVQFGKFREVDFKVDGTPFRCVTAGEWNYDKAKFTDALTKIAKSAKSVFGAFPFDKYTFVYHIGGAGFEGGLEHHNSTVIHLIKTADAAPDDDFLTIAAHELFHAWNVKRLHPAALGPLDYSREARTPSLWFAEGVTDYYAYLLPSRARARSSDWFLKQMADTMNRLEATPERHSKSLEDASRQTWETDELDLDALNYYEKGALVGFYFDLRIREATQGAKSLDDAMRELDAQYGKPNRGYPDDAILTAINKIAGTDLTAEYDRYVRGIEDFDWDAVFAGAGFAMQREKLASLGVYTEGSKEAATEFAPVVKKIYAGLTGEKIGLKLGDMVQNVNGVAVTQSNFVGSIKNLKPGEPLAMDVLRDGKIVSLHGEIGYRWKVTKLTLTPEKELAPLALRIRAGLLAPTGGR